MDTPYVRQYSEDREINAWFLLDLSPSIDFGTVDSEREKRTVLIDFVSTMARLLTRHGNRVGAVFYGDRVERTIPARGGRLQVLRLIDDLLDQPRLASAPFTDLAPLLDAGRKAIRRRSLIFVISDFISSPGWDRSLHLLNRRHDVLAVRLVDPRETELPDVGLLLMEDAETGEQLVVDTHDKRFRRRFAEVGRPARGHGECGVPPRRGGRDGPFDRRGSGPGHRPDGGAPTRRGGAADDLPMAGDARPARAHPARRRCSIAPSNDVVGAGVDGGRRSRSRSSTGDSPEPPARAPPGGPVPGSAWPS